MLFPQRFHAGLADGSVTLTFRSWKRPQVKAGGSYNVGAVALAVETIDAVDPDTISDDDARAAGFATAAEVRELLARYAGDDRTVYRIAFHAEGGAVDRLAPLRNTAALTTDDVSTIRDRLDRLDGRADAPWTRATLALIAEHPGRRAGDLADLLGQDRLPFKASVRKLKALGLTESLEVGYRLSPRGAAYLDLTDR